MDSLLAFFDNPVNFTWFSDLAGATGMIANAVRRYNAIPHHRILKLELVGIVHRTTCVEKTNWSRALDARNLQCTGNVKFQQWAT